MAGKPKIPSMTKKAKIDNRSEWDEFLRGHWQYSQPTKPGTYPCATLLGELAEDRLLYRKLDGKVAQAAGFSSRWGGLWWSVPRPSMPLPLPGDLIRSH